MAQVATMARSQRERLLAATAEQIAERGYRATTVKQIVKCAGVARATFYENFDNREACLLTCFDEAVLGARAEVDAAVDPAAEWPQQIRAGLAALLAHVVDNPALARTCLVESMAAGPAAIERYERALRSATPALARGRELVAAPAELPATLEDSIVGGIAWMIHQRLLHDQVDEIPALLPTMLEFAFAPYLGEARAAELATA